MDPFELPFDPPLTQDGLLDGRVTLLQPEKGFRAGLDSVLLAAAVSGPEGPARALEIGCGAGAALLAAAALRPQFGDRLRLTPHAFDDSLESFLESLSESYADLPGGARMSVHPTPALTAIDLEIGRAHV